MPEHGHRSEAWKSAVTVMGEAQPPAFPEGARVVTARVEFPPGNPGTPPHRHSGPVFGYVLEGEMLYELEGEPPRVIRSATRCVSHRLTVPRYPGARPAPGTRTRWSAPGNTSTVRVARCGRSG